MIIEKGAIVSKAAERSEFKKNISLIHKKNRYLKMDETMERIHNAIEKKRKMWKIEHKYCFQRASYCENQGKRIKSKSKVPEKSEKTNGISKKEVPRKSCIAIRI